MVTKAQNKIRAAHTFNQSLDGKDKRHIDDVCIEDPAKWSGYAAEITERCRLAVENRDYGEIVVMTSLNEGYVWKNR